MKGMPFTKILFVCKGSSQEGIGHVTRSRAVAEAFREFAAIKMIVIGECFVNNLLRGSSFDYVVLSTESEVEHHVNQYEPDIAIFDLLSLSDTVFEHIIRLSTLSISLSPIFNHLGEVDAVFNRTVYVGSHWPPASQSYCGLKYSIIGNHVCRIPESLYRYTLQQDKLAIAISMGGTDAPNKTLIILDALKKFPHSLLIWAILGEGYSHSYSNLVDCIQNSRHEIILTKTNDSMWRILSSCALLFLAGGTTTYEAAYAGLPSINMLEDNKHFYLIQELVEANVCTSIDNVFPDNIDILNHVLQGFYDDRKALLDMHTRTNNLLDKQGAWRIVNQVLNLYNLKNAI